MGPLHRIPPVVLLLALPLFAASLTLRCQDGAVLLLGSVPTLQKVEASLAHSKGATVDQLLAELKSWAGLKEAAGYYDPQAYFRPSSSISPQELTVKELRKKFSLSDNDPSAWFEKLQALGYQVFYRGTLPFSAYVESAGKFAGNTVHIVLDGKEEAPHQRGLNAVVVSGKTLRVVDRKAFDTYADPQENRRFQRFLKALSPGDYLFLAVIDEAARQFDKASFQLLQKMFGAQESLVGRRHFSYILVGEKGATKPLYEDLSNARIRIFLPGKRSLPPHLFHGLIYFHGFASQDRVMWVQ